MRNMEIDTTENRLPLRRAFAALLTLALMFPAPIFAQQAPSAASSPGFTMKVNSDLVLTNVIVRDKKTGEVIKGLKASDFAILEAGKPQRIASFDYESVDQVAALNEATVSGSAGAAPDISLLAQSAPPDATALRDHRLIVMFFDLSSMQPEDLDRAVQAAQDYINKKMQPADLVALVSMATALTTDVDFTQDKAALLRGVARYNGSEGEGMGAGGDGTTNGTADDASSFQADDSEFNAMNTDRELYAIQSIAKSLQRVDQRKSLLYFSGGLTRQGIENEASLRAATNAAVRANMAIYSVDSRGLEAIPPVGDASTGSLRGNAAYTGTSVQNALGKNFSSQETLATLSADTGGTAFFDSNDFAPAFQKVQNDTAAYYLIGFRSTNQKRDGSYRKLTVKLTSSALASRAKIEYRPGYYAPADFKHSSNDDRELQLTQTLNSDLGATDVAVYMEALYFRLADNKFFVPVSLIVPGSQIPFVKGGSSDKATLDVIGMVKNGENIQVGYVRDTVKLAVDQSQQVRRKNIQYTTGFTLAPGKYHLKFVVRENQTGAMGSFETDLQVPDMKKTPLKLSSIVVSSQRVPDTKKSVSPLVHDGLQWVPNVPHVFRQDQHLYFLYEVYNPAPEKQAASSPQAANADAGKRRKKGAAAPSLPVRVLTSIEFLSGSSKVYETPLVVANAINTPERDAVAFQFDVPLDKLKTGLYTCQINVIDDAGGTFSFPRIALLIQPARVVAAPVNAQPRPAASLAPASRVHHSQGAD
ncbi:MAG: VWA domain-containing protein [Acidobacteriaceae bacterium]